MNIEVVNSALTLAVFTIAGIMDYIYREVDPELWLIPAPILGVLGLASIMNKPQGPWSYLYLYAMNGLMVLFVGLMYKIDLIGGADLAAVSFLAIALPAVPNSIFPSVLLSITYSIPFVVAYLAIQLYRACGVRCLARGRVRVKGSYLVEHLHWWIPSGSRIEGDPHEIIARLNAWDKEIEATPLLPLVTLLWLGLSAALLFGDGPVASLLGG
ncbi:MAG: hypothetical protein F7C38_02215 [Desulfurococcales archaeon]|nr:hypothetical protein [Desulfurococcales archaeon]